MEQSTRDRITIGAAIAICEQVWVSEPQARSQLMELQQAGFRIVIFDPPARTLESGVESVGWVCEPGGRTVGDIRYRTN